MNAVGLFEGVGMISRAAEMLGYDKHYLCEKEPYQRQVLAQRFPGCEIAPDVEHLDATAVRGQVDLLHGGSPCFVAGTSILTEDGYKQIEDVREGDLVATHRGRWRCVKYTMVRQVDETVVVRGQGIPDARTTPEHPFLVSQTERRWNNEHRSYDRVRGDEKWLGAGECEKHLSLLRLPSVHINGPDLDQFDRDSVMWVLGRYVADGHVSGQRQVCLSIGRAKIEEVECKLNKLGLATRVEEMRTVRRYHISSRLLADIAESFGRGALYKTIPAWVLTGDQRDAQNFLDGYLSGDGDLKRDSIAWRATTVSKHLALSLAILYQRLAGVAASVDRVDVPSTTVIEGRVVNQNTQFQVTAPLSNRSAVIEDDDAWRLIRSVKPAGAATVYNISVEEDESYIADGAVVHNCQGFSVAGLGEALHDPRSKLIFELLRVVGECQPRVVLIENVAVLRSRGLSVIVDALARMDYLCWWDCVPALAVGAPHLRDRVWITAVRADEMPDLDGRPFKEATTKFPRAGALTRRRGLIEMDPSATIKACKEAMGAVRLDDGTTWLTKLDSPLFPTPVVGDSRGTRNATANRSEGQGHHHSGTTLSDYVRLWPTPHGFRRDEYARPLGPSGNELGFAVNEEARSQRLWPTAGARDYKDMALGDGAIGRGQLPEAVRDSFRDERGVGRIWPTPTSTLGPNGGLVTPAKAREGGTLIEAVSADEFGSRVWPTPRASANELRTLSSAPSHGNGHGLVLSGVVCDIERDEGRVVPPTSGSAGPLNPYWVEWLMGMPIGWTDTDLSNADLVQLDWSSEYGLSRVAEGVPKRKERLICCGNACLWQIAYLRIAQAHEYLGIDVPIKTEEIVYG